MSNIFRRRLTRASIFPLVLVACLAPAMAKPAARTALPSTVVPACDWDRPGHNPYMGDTIAAVERYPDIPNDVRDRLKARMVSRSYDDVVTIRRDSITGKARYGSAIRDMHFGTRQMCRSVSRSAWTPQMQERGLVYCEAGQCILVPTVCRNVSRISRAQVADERAVGDVVADDAVPVAETVPQIALGAGPPALLEKEAGPSFASASELPQGGGGGGYFAGSTAAGAPGPGALSRAAAGATLRLDGSSPPATVVTPVPEPETWGLMLGGLAALAWQRRRQKRRTI